MLILLSILIVSALSIIFMIGYKNTKQVIVNNIYIDQSEKEQEVFRVLHISDMHLENISITPSQLFTILENEAIDIIALTGDFLDRKRSIPKLLPYLHALNKLNPRYGIYAVFGNHDYVLRNPDFAQLKKLLEDNGCKTMVNENAELWIKGKRINIIGIDDYSTKRSNVEKSYEGLSHGYNLVLTHDPNIVLQMNDIPYDYLLSGHFHGGQIHWPKPYHLVKMGKLVRMNMIKGLHSHEGKSFYISEGLGQTGVNIRFGSRPEITMHHIPLTSN